MTTTQQPTKTYRAHYCARRHRDNRTLARCLWSRAHWILGNGNYACISKCRGTTVTLWPTEAEAQNAKNGIDATACGGACVRRHEVIRLLNPADMKAAA